MYYLKFWRIPFPIPIPDRWWAKHLMGATWLTEALIEVTLAQYYLYQYPFYTTGWLWIPVSLSTWFAAICGAIHFSLGNVQWYREWQEGNRNWKGVILIISSLMILLLITIVSTSK